MTITYVPATLRSMIQVSRTGVMNREGEAYCVECAGKTGDFTHKYGALIIEATIREIDHQLAKHDPNHHVTFVDRDNCQMGM